MECISRGRSDKVVFSYSSSYVKAFSVSNYPHNRTKTTMFGTQYFKNKEIQVKY